MIMAKMRANDAPSAKLATAFVTIGNRRYAMLMARNFEAKATVETADVPMLGSMIKGKKAVGLEISFSMTVYKCTEIFDNIIEKFKQTGVMPTFDIQVTSEDKQTTIGRSTKVYNDCVIDGDVLLSMFDDSGEFVEQTITGFAMNYESPEKYTNPSYM